MLLQRSDFRFIQASREELAELFTNPGFGFIQLVAVVQLDLAGYHPAEGQNKETKLLGMEIVLEGQSNGDIWVSCDGKRWKTTTASHPSDCVHCNWHGN